MRRFELVENSSSKFWEVELSGTELTVRFGRIGTQGQSKTKSFASDAAASKEHDKLVKEKTGKGYAEVAVAEGAALASVESSAAPAVAADQIDNSQSTRATKPIAATAAKPVVSAEAGDIASAHAEPAAISQSLAVPESAPASASASASAAAAAAAAAA